jgi:hypothetical protein
VCEREAEREREGVCVREAEREREGESERTKLQKLGGCRPSPLFVQKTALKSH